MRRKALAGRSCAKYVLSLCGLFAMLVVEVGRFVSAFGVCLVQDVRIGEDILCGSMGVESRKWNKTCI